MKTHITVLTKEAVDALAIKQNATVVDATVGTGGHTRHIISKLGKEGVCIGIDADPEAIQIAEQTLTGNATIYFRVGNFRNINSILDDIGIHEVNAVLGDLGWRTEQFGGNGKGFSFMVDEPLIMTYGDPESYQFVARDILNEWDEIDIAHVLTGYGEERFARKIARKIVEVRTRKPIMTTFDLVAVIKDAVPSFYHHHKIHFATRTFQALRIAVNDELKALESFIEQSILRLAPAGRLAIISFHSLEDRIVKHTFREYAHNGNGNVLTKKPITATSEELEKNPRARSAKLRIFEKI